MSDDMLIQSEALRQAYCLYGSGLKTDKKDDESCFLQIGSRGQDMIETMEKLDGKIVSELNNKNKLSYGNGGGRSWPSSAVNPDDYSYGYGTNDLSNKRDNEQREYQDYEYRFYITDLGVRDGLIINQRYSKQNGLQLFADYPDEAEESDTSYYFGFDGPNITSVQKAIYDEESTTYYDYNQEEDVLTEYIDYKENDDALGILYALGFYKKDKVNVYKQGKKVDTDTAKLEQSKLDKIFGKLQRFCDYSYMFAKRK